MSSNNKYSIKESHFISKGLKCAGTLYLPNLKNEKLPIVILAHGFAAERSFRLPAFADCFARNGIAAYFFDYRTFGDSEGEPRHLVDPKAHQEDWHNAISFVANMEQIDPKKIAIWGSSFSGGHVLQVGAESKDVAAIISQVPHVDGFATTVMGKPIDILKASFAAVKDYASQAILNKPFYSQVVGKTDQFAAMNAPEAWDGWHAIVPKDSPWKNQVQSKIFLSLPLYSPAKFASKIKVPTLIIAGNNDTITPAKAAQKAANKIKQAEFHLLECNHFQAYIGEHFEENIELQLNFLKRHLSNR